MINAVGSVAGFAGPYLMVSALAGGLLILRIPVARNQRRERGTAIQTG